MIKIAEIQTDECLPTVEARIFGTQKECVSRLQKDTLTLVSIYHDAKETRGSRVDFGTRDFHLIQATVGPEES